MHANGRIMLADSPRLILVHVVVESAIDKLDIVSHLSPGHKAEVSHDDSIATILEQRRMIETQYRLLMEQRQLHHHTWNRKMIAEDGIAALDLVRKMRTLDEAMQKRVRNEKATNTFVLGKIRREKMRALAVLQRAVNELETEGTCNSLLAVIEEQHERDEKYESTLEAVRKTLLSNTELEKTLAFEKEQCASEEASMAKEIAQLKTSMEQLRIELGLKQKMTEAENDAHVRSERRVVQMAMSKLTEKLKEMEAELRCHQKAFSYSEAFLKRKHALGEVELNEWQKKMGTEVTHMERKLDQLKADRRAQVQDLGEWKAVLKREETDKAARTEQARRKLEKENRERVASIKIQANVRGWLARKLIASMKDGSKKKGKKDKKDKKGKKK